MCRFLTVLALVAGLAGALPAVADSIVLKDGRTLQSAGPYMVKGRQALITQPDGTLVSIPLAEIDVEKTAAARQISEAPTPTPSVKKPLTPAEAARQKSGRKAALVLTDDEVAQSIGTTDPEKKDEAEERVEIGSTNATKVKGGYAITGSVINSGKIDVSGVSVTIEAVGEGNKTIASAFGQVAKDNLSSGEKSAFTATVTTDKDATLFHYVPRWQTRVGVKPGTPGGDNSAGASPTPPAAADQALKGEKEKTASEAAPTPIIINRPDVAARPPNAAVGAPTQPGGAYLPKPTGDQPKTPSGN